MIGVILTSIGTLFAEAGDLVGKREARAGRENVQGLAFLAESFAYSFAPASIIMAAKRSSATTWSMLSGQFVFSEKNFLFKITVFVALVAGILLLVL